MKTYYNYMSRIRAEKRNARIKTLVIISLSMLAGIAVMELSIAWSIALVG